MVFIITVILSPGGWDRVQEAKDLVLVTVNLNFRACDWEILRRQRSNTNAQGLRMTGSIHSWVQVECIYTDPQIHIIPREQDTKRLSDSATKRGQNFYKYKIPHPAAPVFGMTTIKHFFDSPVSRLHGSTITRFHDYTVPRVHGSTITHRTHASRMHGMTEAKIRRRVYPGNGGYHSFSKKSSMFICSMPLKAAPLGRSIDTTYLGKLSRIPRRLPNSRSRVLSSAIR